MADSVDPHKPEQPAESTELVVRNADGKTFSTRIKGKDGKFMRKGKGMPSSQQMTKLGRKILTKRITLEDGNITTVFEHMTWWMTEIARGTAGNDPKEHMAAVQAYKVVLERLVGKIPPSDEELEALQTGGVKVLIIQPPQLMNNDLKKDSEEPKFIPAEIVEENKEEKKDDKN